MPLLRVMVIPRQEQMDIRPLSEAEKEALAEQEAAYIMEETTTSSRWFDVAGNKFTHLYKQWSPQYRQKNKPNS